MTGGLLLAQTWLVIVTGLAGEPRYRETFAAQAAALRAAATDRLGLPADRIVHLGESTTPRATVAEIGPALDRVARDAEPGATVVLVLLGHGSAVGGRPRFHLPGPDLTAEDLSRMLVAFPTQEVVVVGAFSTSGAWMEHLSGPRRTVLTATRSAVERDETRFGRFFVEGLGSAEADQDKNGRLSVLEAFEYARGAVARFYSADRQLQTEHALLDDDGDGTGTLEPDPARGGDGIRAAALYLDAGPAVSGDPALAGLVARRDSLERAVAALRQRRERMAPEAYEAELETLLLELARVSRALREREQQP